MPPIRSARLRDAVDASDWHEVLEVVAEYIEPHRGEGRVATYIPALARVDPHHFGIAVHACDGSGAQAGDADEVFSIQSLSKVFTLTLALRELGDSLWDRVGREPSGTAFNSIVQLERESGLPRNPFINAGALVVTDALVSCFGTDGALAAIVDLLRRLSGNPRIDVDDEVAASEAATGHRNASLAHFLASFGRLANPVPDVLSVYFRQCALAMSCVDLARAGQWLANNGVQPGTGETVTTAERARRINAVMLTCGHYDAAGDFAYRVGLPGKSGVGGGILAIVPGRCSVAVWSPGLNESGNSAVGTLALEALVDCTGLAIL